jgi:hypothetical protein
VPGIHFSINNRICGLCAVFHKEHVVISSLQKSSPNSCCSGGFHTPPVILFEILGLVKLDTLVHFGGQSIFSNGADKRSGLGLGDPVGIADAHKPGFI